MIVVVVMVVIMRVVVAIVGMVVAVMMVAMMGIARAKVRATLGGVGRRGLDQAIEIAPQGVESGGFVPRALVHVELAVHLDLQAVSVRGRIGKRPHQLHSLVGV